MLVGMIVGISASYLYARYEDIPKPRRMLEPLRRIAKWLYERSLYVPRFMRWVQDKFKRSRAEPPRPHLNAPKPDPVVIILSPRCKFPGPSRYKRQVTPRSTASSPCTPIRLCDSLRLTGNSTEARRRSVQGDEAVDLGVHLSLIPGGGRDLHRCDRNYNNGIGLWGVQMRRGGSARDLLTCL